MGSFDSQKDKRDIFILKKFLHPTNPNLPYQLEGLFYHTEHKCLHEIEVFSADPNIPKWDSQKFKYMDDYYEAQEIKLDEVPFQMTSPITQQYKDSGMAAFGNMLVSKNVDENKMIGASAFYEFLKKSKEFKPEESKQALSLAQALLEKIGMQIIDVDCDQLKSMEISQELKKLVIDLSDTSKQKCSA